MSETPFFGAVVGKSDEIAKILLKIKIIHSYKIFNLTYIQGYIKGRNRTSELNDT